MKIFSNPAIRLSFLLFLLVTPMLPAATYTVTTAADEFDTPSGANVSLREAIRDAAANAGADTILFDASLSGATITLTGGIPINGADAAGVTIDGSSLPAGVTIHGNNAGRVVDNPGNLTLRALTLTGGSLGPCCGGAAVYNHGTMTLERCTITNNIAGYGPAIFTEVGSPTTLKQCTLSANTATAQAGAVYNRGTTILVHCTVAGNASQADSGGIYNRGDGWFSLENSIVAGNTAATVAPDIYNFGSLTNLGVNIVQGFAGSGSIVGGGTITNVAPLLGALANNGGPTKTMMPQSGSPAIDAAVGSVETIDQRGFLRPVDGDGNGSVIADIGAVEVQSPNGNLASLILSAGTLSPSFVEATTNYTATVSSATISITITPTAAETNATIKVNSSTVISGASSGAIALNNGTNTITVVVTAPNGTTTKTYVVAVYRPAFVVTTIADSGAGSLRQVMTDAAAEPGVDVITFDPALNNQVITLTNGALGISDSDAVTIDASALAAGLTINGNGTDRIVVNTAALTLRGVTLVRGFCAPNNGGGAVLNYGALMLDRCNISSNTAGYGAAIWNNDNGAVTLERCTLTNNNASSTGGAIYARNDSSTTLRQCTLSDNTANSAGGLYANNNANVTLAQCTLARNSGTGQSGAVENRGTMSMVHCTVAENTSPTIGGIFNYIGTLTLENSIIGKNSGGSGADFNNQGTVVQKGLNIIQTAVQGGGGLIGSGIITNVPALLSPLANNGGATKTMLAFGFAIDAAVGSTETNDQRDLVRPVDGDGNGAAVADIGAVELAAGDGVFLANLVLSAGTLSPTFFPGSTNYNAVVPEAANSITVTPTSLSAFSTVTVNGATVTSGNASSGIALNPGANIITVIVTGQGGAPSKTYRVTVTRTTPPTVTSPIYTSVPGPGAILSGNVTSDGGGPITVRGVVLSITATNNDPQIGGNGVINLTTNGTTGVFAVTATNLVPLTAYKFKAYAINLSGTTYTSAGTFITPDNNANLTSLILSTGTLSPVFASGTTNYIVNVPDGVTSLTVTPTRSSSTAVISVNGTVVASGAPSGNIALNSGATTITNSVLAQDGTIKIYSIVVHREYLVTTNADIGAGSLRQALIDAAASSGPDTITFSSTLSGATITLTNGTLGVNDSSGVIVDASALAGGITINGNGVGRIIQNDGTLTMRALTFMGGYSGSVFGGGAILNYGTLTLERSTLSGNTGGLGSAIWNNGGGSLTLRQCTISGNTALTQAGAIDNRGTALLVHTTVSSNSAPSIGGINNSSVLTLENSIVAANTGNSGADLNNQGTLTRAGANIIQTAIVNSGTITGSGTISNVVAQLSPLNNYGGATKTMLPLTGSPAIDAAVASTETTDQRGYSRPVDGDGDSSAIADLGATELAQTDGAFLVNLTFSAGVVNPFDSSTTNYTVSVPQTVTNISVTPTAFLANASITVNGTAVVSGTASGTLALNMGGPTTITIVAVAPNGTTTKTYTATVIRALRPTVVSPSYVPVTGPGAVLGGNVTSDNGAPITARGVVLARTSINNDPQIGGNGVTNLTTSGTTGAFTVAINNLLPLTAYTFKAYAINVDGTGYSSTGSFTTFDNNARLAGLVLSTGYLLNPFSSGTTNYSAIVDAAQVTVTPIRDAEVATIAVNGSTVASGTASAPLALNVGTNTITILVTAQDGTTKIYMVTALRPRSVVSNLNDSGAGSLRSALTNAAANPGLDAIIFSPALSGGTINLSLVLNTADPNGVIVDATALPAGITINGNGTNRVFQNDGILTVRGVTITGGYCSPTSGGGGVLNSSLLILERCTLTGNVGGYGAALFNAPNRSITLRHCTIAANTATYSAGAMENRGVASFIHCTVVGNSAPDTQIGGIVNGFADGPFPLDDPENVPNRILSIENSIVANNTGFNVNGRGHPNLASKSFVSYYGLNIIPGIIPGNTSAAVLNTDPHVASLSNYGGPTQTMPPLITSPAIDAAIGSTENADQRGFSRPVDGDGNGIAVADIGAVEWVPDIVVSIPPTNQTALSGTNATFSVTATGSNLSYRWFFNGNMIPGANSSSLNITNINRASAGSYFVVISNSTFAVTSSVVQLHPVISQKFQSVTQGSDGRWTLKFNDLDGSLLTSGDLSDFEVQASTNLVQWTILTNALTLTNGVLHFTEPSAGIATNRFFRVRSK